MTEQKKFELQAKIQKKVTASYDWTTYYGKPAYTVVVTEDGDRLTVDTTPTTGKLRFTDARTDAVYIAGKKKLHDLRDADEIVMAETEADADTLARISGKIAISFGAYDRIKEGMCRLIAHKTVTLISTDYTTSDGLDRATALVRRAESDPLILKTPVVEDWTDITKAKKEEEKINFYDFLDLDRAGGISGVNKNRICEYLIRHNHFLILKGSLYYYKDGAYIRDDEGAREGIQTISWANECIMPDLRDERIGKSVYTMIIQRKSLVRQEREVNKQPGSYICFKNGYYDLANNDPEGEKKMLPHNPDDYCLNLIPYDYEPNKKTVGPMIDDYLKNTFTRENGLELMLEYGAYTMTKDRRIQKFIIMQGPAGTGKSIFIKLVGAMLGEENYATLDLKRIAMGTFSGGDLWGKLANLCGEIPSSALEQPAFIKQLTGGDRVTGEEKYKKSYGFFSYAKMIFSCNGLPKILNESSDGFFRRCIIVQVDRKIDKKLTGYEDQLMRELDHFIHRCVEAGEKLFHRDDVDLIDYEDSNRRAEDYSRLANSVKDFIKTKLEPAEGGAVTKKVVYEAYKRFCGEDGRTPKKKSGFFATIADNAWLEEKTVKGYECYTGIKIKNDEKTLADEGFEPNDGKHGIPAEGTSMLDNLKEFFRLKTGYEPMTAKEIEDEIQRMKAQKGL